MELQADSIGNIYKRIILMKLFNRWYVYPIAALTISFLPIPVSSEEPVFDVVLLGGRVIDPETGLDGIHNVGIAGGTIKAISKKSLEGLITEDVSGLVVAPGFIDLHAHGQHRVGQQYHVRDGVTTSLDMEGGAWPVNRFYRLREGRSLINYGATVSYEYLRLELMTGVQSPDLEDTEVNSWDDFYKAVGEEAFNTPVNNKQLQTLLQEIEKGYSQGALGVGFGIGYFPGAGRKEIYELFKHTSSFDAPIFIHVRGVLLDKAPGGLIATAQEAISNAAVTGASMQLVHVASSGLKDTPIIIEMIEKAQQQGIDITTEVYPYTAFSTNIGASLFNEGWRRKFQADYSDLQWSETGERLTEETFFKYRHEKPGGFVIAHVLPESAVNYAVAHPIVSIASDGIPWITGGEHPRGAGTFARVLGRYVRENWVLTLMQALRKMTIMPAQRLEGFAPSMARKGRVQVGADADIVVFDPDTVIDEATFANPMQYSSGFKHVLVNGVFVVKNGGFEKDIFPGKPVQNSHVAQ